MNCRICSSTKMLDFANLGKTPISNRFLSKEELGAAEPKWPLFAKVCTSCWLVQLEEFEKNQNIFNDDYAYFSSFSTSWLNHARSFVDKAIKRMCLSQDSFVVEIASNDGYLLKNFEEYNIPCLGVEPCGNVAQAAREVGVNTIERFFGEETSQWICSNYRKADLVVANNVLAHVPNLHDFASGLKCLLSQNGVVSIEFPHLLELIRNTQFDTIYHEHYSYLSLTALIPLFLEHGLEVFNVEKLATHGGSLRLYLCHNGQKSVANSVSNVLFEERKANFENVSGYAGFQTRIDSIKSKLLSLLSQSKDRGNTIVAYGAAAKGNTLLNYCGIGTDTINWIADSSPRKQGTYTPGMHIPVVSPERITQDCPDEVVILPWNIQEEIISYLRNLQSSSLKRAIVAIPTPRIIDL